MGVAVLAGLMALAGGHDSRSQEAAQGLTVQPVSFEMPSGQKTAVLNIQNRTAGEVAFQVRPYAWDQQAGGEDRLTPTDALTVSPPLGRIAVGGQQVVRLVLRKPAQDQEASYRVLVDQVPPPAQPGVVSIALRLSIPVFAQPPKRQAAKVEWSLQSEGGVHYLVAVNRGGTHEVVRGLALAGADGHSVALESDVSPYVLPGATRRWRIVDKSFAPSREALHLRARANSGSVDQMISATSVRP